MSEPVVTPLLATEAPAPRAPSLLDLGALIPFALLDLVVGVWAHLHLEWFGGWFGSNVVLAGAFGALWKWIPKKYVEGTQPLVASLLSSPKVTRALWVAFALVSVSSLFATSVRISAHEPQAPVVIYQLVQAPTTSADVASASEIMRLDRGAPSSSRLIFTSPLGSSRWFAESDNRWTAERRAWPWVRVSLTWPDDFNGPLTLAVLPAPRFMQFMGGASHIVLQVTEAGAGGAIIAEDTVNAFGALLVSGAQPVVPDSITHARWIAAARATFVKDSNVTPIVDAWMRSRWISARRSLRTGERLRVILRSSTGDTLAIESVQLKPSLNDVILRRTS